MSAFKLLACLSHVCTGFLMKAQADESVFFGLVDIYGW